MKKCLALFLALLMVLSLCACGGKSDKPNQTIGKLNQTITADNISLIATEVRFSSVDDRKVECTVSYIVDNNTGKEITFIGASTLTKLIYEDQESEPNRAATWYTVKAYSTINGSTSFYLPKEAETSDKPIYLEMRIENSDFKIQIR